MAIDKPKKKKPGFSFEGMDNFETQVIVSKESTPVLSTDGTEAKIEQPKKRGRKPGTKLAKSYKFQLVPGAKETQILITIPVELHEEIKTKASKIGETVKEFVSKKLAAAVDFHYTEDIYVYSEAKAIAAVAEHPLNWNKLDVEYRTLLVFQTIINTAPGWFTHLDNVTDELKASITKEQWIRIVEEDLNSLKKVPSEHMNYVLKSIKEKLNG